MANELNPSERALDRRSFRRADPTLPHGFVNNGTPSSSSFMGKSFGDAKMLAVAKMYQDATEFHLRQPQEFAVGQSGGWAARR
jgi:hypothetical protein